MAQSPSPEDRPDPSEHMPAVRARVPEHVAAGQISTGVIVVTGATEYILDFVRNLPRPNMIVARVVLPHTVMPQFTEALNTNITLYRQRFGEIPSNTPGAVASVVQEKSTVPMAAVAAGPTEATSSPASSPLGQSNVDDPTVLNTGTAGNQASANSNAMNSPTAPPTSESPAHAQPPTSSQPPASSSLTRHASPQEVYDDLKLKDELLSGTYANAVMIGHGPHEFCFDFITNFYPQSAVSCRVFMAAGHVGRLLESLRASWDQLRPRLGGNP